MREKTNQDSIDERIHRFMARKTPMRTVSKTIADHLVSEPKVVGAESGIYFERIRWRPVFTIQQR